MVFWTAAFGALLAWCALDFEMGGLFLGGLLGGIWALILRRGMRKEIAAAAAELRAELLVLPATPSVDAPVAPAADPRPAFERIVPAASEPLRTAERETPAPWTAEPIEPAAPGALTTAVAATIAMARTWLLGGNTIVRVGLVILFVGLSFLASYAASAGLFPIELRLALVLLVGAALLVVGFRTRAARPGFGLWRRSRAAGEE